MKSNPQLIPSDDLGVDDELLIVGRETTLASGKIDLLGLSRSGDVVLVEFKTGPQNPDFRHALAQVIDYGSDLWRLTVEDFDRGVVQRHLRSSHCDAAFKEANNLAEAIACTAWDLTDVAREALLQRLSEVLETGAFTYVIAAQRFTPAMVTSLDYLNTTMRHGRFYLVEIVRLHGQDLIAHAAQVVAAPPKALGGSGSVASAQASEADFLESLTDEAYREAMKDIFSTVATLGFTVYWGSKGASFRLATPGRSEPISIAWAFPADGQWNGARHLTLGVDRSSLQQAPSVEAAVLAYVDKIKTIAGSDPVSSKLDARTFGPVTVPAAKDAIVEVLEWLANATNDDNETQSAG